MAKVYATRTQIVKISDLLREHLKPADTVGVFEYVADAVADWSDARIAAAVATPENPVHEGHVADIRAELYGTIRKPASSAPADDARIARLGADLAAERGERMRLAARLEELAGLHAKLCRSLRVNHQIDVAHLAGSMPDRPIGTTRMLDLAGGAQS